MAIVIFVGAMVAQLFFKVSVPWYVCVAGAIAYIGDCINSLKK